MGRTQIEKEIVGLWIACGSLDSLVNHELLTIYGEGETTEVHFETATHQRLFNILLLDFLENVDETLMETQGSCLEILVGACRSASFDENGSVKSLKGSVDTLRTWLNAEIIVPTWLPSIDQQIDLKLQRRESIYICGNISKHNPARLTGAAKRLADILGRHGVTVNSIQALNVLDDFYRRFHDDIFNYHSTVIAELLNNVRWGIHDYLATAYLKAYLQDPNDPMKYSYRFPAGVSDGFSKSCYWDLMNLVRRQPYMKRFIAHRLLKLRY